MNTAKHTPGPWVVEGSDITNDYPDQGSRILIAEKVAIESDAHLIAAAPAMYEALQAMVIANHGLPINPMDEKDEICRRALEKAQKALAQAEGK